MSDPVDEILNRPYQRVLIPDRDSGAVTAFITEFPGCIAEGLTLVGALEALDQTARTWVESVLSRGFDVPPPREGKEYSGRFPLRLPRSLHRRVAMMAEDDGVSLNTFLVGLIAHGAGANTDRSLGSSSAAERGGEPSRGESGPDRRRTADSERRVASRMR